MMIFFLCRQQLRMPLDTDKEPLAGTLDRFNRPILGVCGDGKSRCGCLDTLMMERVCVDLRFADDRMETGALCNVHVMTGSLMVVFVLIQ